MYKRPQLNLLWVVDLYLQIKAGHLPRRPVTVFFAGKAAPAYIAAKNVIHGILVFSRVVNDDPQVSPWLKVVMLPNYNVSMAEKLLPATDLSEQCPLASKEASGTGNMKMMLNGAVTIGTLDGANVEIAELVGQDNIFIFGQSSDQVIAHYEKHDYVPSEWYARDERIRAAADFLISDRMCRAGDRNLLRQLYDELTGQDDFMALLDFRSYCEVKNKALEAYEDASGEGLLTSPRRKRSRLRRRDRDTGVSDSSPAETVTSTPGGQGQPGVHTPPGWNRNMPGAEDARAPLP